MKTKLILLIYIFIINQIAYGSINPTRLDDPRIQTINYNAKNVINIKCKIGQATMIEFEPGEEVIYYGFGDSEAWHFTKNKNIIIIKPKAVDPDTNLLIKTNKRIYSFDLTTKGQRAVTYHLQFTYKDNNTNNVNYANTNKYIYKYQGKLLNYNYWGRGDKELSPLGIYDDGLFTYIDFKNLSDLPSVYKIMPDGKEAMVQFHMENGVMVVHELTKEMYIRFGKKVLGVRNKNFDNSFKTAKFNKSGTSKNSFNIRILKNRTN